MRIFLQFLILLSFSQLNLAQELRTFQLTKPNYPQIQLNPNWDFSIHKNMLTFKNGKIENLGPKLKSLNLEFYLLTNSKVQNGATIDAFYLNGARFKDIKQNEKLVNIDFQHPLNENFEAGDYTPLIVVKKGDKIVDYQLLDQSFPWLMEQNNSTIVKQTLNFKEDNMIHLENEWKVEIDFKNFMVKTIGGDISNSGNQDESNLILDVYLMNSQSGSETSGGQHIASAPLNLELKKQEKLNNLQVKTNLKTIPVNGTYSVLLTLSTLDGSGQKAVRTKRVFPNQISF